MDRLWGSIWRQKVFFVIDSGEITDREGIRRTPAEHIIQSGDYICEIDGKVLTGKKQLLQLVRENQGEPMELQVIRHRENDKTGNEHRWRQKTVPINSVSG